MPTSFMFNSCSFDARKLFISSYSSYWGHNHHFIKSWVFSWNRESFYTLVLWKDDIISRNFCSSPELIRGLESLRFRESKFPLAVRPTSLVYIMPGLLSFSSSSGHNQFPPAPTNSSITPLAVWLPILGSLSFLYQFNSHETTLNLLLISSFSFLEQPNSSQPFDHRIQPVAAPNPCILHG